MVEPGRRGGERVNSRVDLPEPCVRFPEDACGRGAGVPVRVQEVDRCVRVVAGQGCTGVQLCGGSRVRCEQLV